MSKSILPHVGRFWKMARHVEFFAGVIIARSIIRMGCRSWYQSTRTARLRGRSSLTCDPISILHSRLSNEMRPWSVPPIRMRFEPLVWPYLRRMA